MKIVIPGGGTGLSRIAELLAFYYDQNALCLDQLTVIQHPYDNGKHSGLLMRQCGFWAGIGDFRKSIIALSAASRGGLVSSMLEFRFKKQHLLDTPESECLEGVSSGNILMAGLMAMYKKSSSGSTSGGLLEAIEGFSRLCNMPDEFKVMPVSLDPAVLVARLFNGQIIRGQDMITKHPDFGDKKIVSIELEAPPGKPHPKITPQAEEAIVDADLIIIPPGSPWTSNRPNLIVHGVKDAIQRSKARIVMIPNIATQKNGESAYWSSAHYVEEMHKAIGRIDETYSNNCRTPLTFEMEQEGWELIPYRPIDLPFLTSPITDTCADFLSIVHGKPQHNAKLIEMIMQ